MRTGCRNTNAVVAKNAITTLVQDDANSPKSSFKTPKVLL